LGLPGKITCRDVVVKPVAIDERSVAANKNLRIQNSGRRRDTDSGVYVRGDSYRRPLDSAGPDASRIEPRFSTPH
jgi:hypothetical protein